MGYAFLGPLSVVLLSGRACAREMRRTQYRTQLQSDVRLILEWE